MRVRRDAGVVECALQALRQAVARVGRGELATDAATGSALMPRIIEAVRARVTVGEISDALASQWGQYDAGSVRLEHTEGARG